MQMYAVGDIEFSGNDRYLDPFNLTSTIEEIVAWRNTCHSSLPMIVYKVDASKSKMIMTTPGMVRSRKHKMFLVVERIGAYFDLLQNTSTETAFA